MTEQQKEAEKLWDSILINKMPGLAQKHTAIYKEWMEDKERYGPPTTWEFDSTDEHGNHIIRQNFMNARAAFADGKVTWLPF